MDAEERVRVATREAERQRNTAAAVKRDKVGRGEAVGQFACKRG